VVQSEISSPVCKNTSMKNSHVCLITAFAHYNHSKISIFAYSGKSADTPVFYCPILEQLIASPTLLPSINPSGLTLFRSG